MRGWSADLHAQHASGAVRHKGSNLVLLGRTRKDVNLIHYKHYLLPPLTNIAQKLDFALCEWPICRHATAQRLL